MSETRYTIRTLENFTYYLERKQDLYFLTKINDQTFSGVVLGFTDGKGSEPIKWQQTFRDIDKFISSGHAQGLRIHFTVLRYYETLDNKTPIAPTMVITSYPVISISEGWVDQGKFTAHDMPVFRRKAS